MEAIPFQKSSSENYCDLSTVGRDSGRIMGHTEPTRYAIVTVTPCVRACSA